ncbi:MAG TPA: Hsp20/alpha crystallin family protein [Terriglobales bacterium]|jgi:HSP20 family protein
MAIRSLIRRDSYNPDIFNFRRNLDDVFSRLLTVPSWDRWSGSQTNADWIPAVESYIDQNKFHVRVALPGVKPEEVSIQVHGNELSIAGERKQELAPSEDRSFQQEILYGAFERIVPMPEGVQSDKVEANYHNGVLEVSAPLSEKAIPRKILIKSTEGGKKLAA